MCVFVCLKSGGSASDFSTVKVSSLCDLSFTLCLAATPRKYLKTQHTLDYIWIILLASHSPTLPFIFESHNQHTLNILSQTLPRKLPVSKIQAAAQYFVVLSCGQRGQHSEARAEFLRVDSTLNHSFFISYSAFSILSVSDW